MKKLLVGATIYGLAFTMGTHAASTPAVASITASFVKGNPEIASINALSFGPNGVLFIGDSKNAAIYALNTNDVSVKDTSEDINLENFDTTVAASLGTTADNIKITDMAVNPISKTVYFSVNILNGTPVLLKLKGNSIENVSLKSAQYSKVELNNAVADVNDNRGRPQRVWAISDMMYHNGNVLVSGLSNKEFKSTFRSIPFPFNKTQDHASLEIYHAAHGKYETHAPIKAFNVVNIDSKDYLMASYTCTPLVLFPIDTLKNGKHIKGRTISELGWGNSPLDIISFEKNGKSYFLMSNSNRSMMRLDVNDIATSKENMTKQAGISGVPYVPLPLVNVLQLSNLDAEKIVYIQRTSEGDLVLKTRPTKWI